MGLSEAAKAKKREYARKWREKNRERVNQRQREWYHRNHKKALEYKRKWQRKNAEKVKAYKNKYWENMDINEKLEDKNKDQTG